MTQTRNPTPSVSRVVLKCHRSVHKSCRDGHFTRVLFVCVRGNWKSSRAPPKVCSRWSSTTLDLTLALAWCYGWNLVFLLFNWGIGSHTFTHFTCFIIAFSQLFRNKRWRGRSLPIAIPPTPAKPSHPITIDIHHSSIHPSSRSTNKATGRQPKCTYDFCGEMLLAKWVNRLQLKTQFKLSWIHLRYYHYSDYNPNRQPPPRCHPNTIIANY